jgi:hypothetical protein
MKRRYGRDSEAVRTFKGACAAAFDEVFAYRFTWKLRNYMQHCDLPFGRVEFVCTEGTTVDSGAEFAARLMFDPQVLLKRYDGWGPVRNDLEELREPFEVFPILAEVVAELTKIESACIEMEVPELRAAISIIQSIIADEYDPERGFAVVDLAEVSRSAHRSGATIAYQIIPTHLVREFQQALIRAGHPPTA